MCARFIIILCSFLLLLTACTKSIDPNYSEVKVSKRNAPKKCTYIGPVKGRQSTTLLGMWTSNKQVNEGALNDLVNNSARMGANYVKLTSGVLKTDTYPKQKRFNPVNGLAYYCPNR